MSVVLAIVLLVAAAVATLFTVASSAGADSSSATTNSGDNLRTGWYSDQPELDPATVSGPGFGQLYSLAVQGQVYAQPLVSNGVLLVATEHNQVYGFNPSTQAQLWNQNLGTPVPKIQTGSLNCVDLSPEIGVTSTPVVDPTTNTMYVMSSVQRPGGSAGSFLADFYLHALDVTTGAERPNFPVKIQGNADNDPTVKFDGTYQLQRPGLLLMNGVVYAGFSGHCDIGLYQGWVTGVSTTTAQITAMWSDEVSPGANAADGPGGGIWMSGSGLVSDASGDIVFTTGNGTPPATGPGTSDNGALGQSQVRVRVQPDGTLKAVDHFAPYDASVLNESDSDVGSGGVIALPPQYFGTAAYPRLMVTMGKQGYLWMTDATNMGGVGQGPLGSNAVVSQVGPVQGGVRGKPAVWGGDGGYVYLETSQAGSGTGRLLAYKYGLDGNGKPTLTQAGQSDDLFGFGSGSPIVTSDGTSSGSALVWSVWFPPSSANPNLPGLGAQLRAYDAVPVNGHVVLRRSYPIDVGTKFALPGVDNGRLYVPTNDGHVVAFGSPISAPLSGSTVNFPRTTVGSSSTATATVTAASALTINSITSNNPAITVVSSDPALPATLATGATMQVQLQFTPTASGGTGGVLKFDTTAGPWALSTSAVGQSAGPELQQFPCCLSYGGVVVGSTKTDTINFSNQGAAPLIINSYNLPSAPFSVTGLPPAGSSIASGQSFAATFTFAPTSLGLFTDALELNTNDPKALGFDGPNQTIAAGAVALSGTGGNQPVMAITPRDINYGSVPVGTTATQTFTITNTGGTDLTINISKAPGGAGFTAATSLPESTLIPAGQTVTERVDFTPTAVGSASDTWAITGDDAGGRQVVTFHGTGTAAVTPSISIADLDVSRPLTGQVIANVPVTLSRASSAPVTMTYTTKDGTATVGGGDYTSASGTLTFAPGDTTKIIPVTINGANPTSVAETLTITLGKVTGATPADATAKLYLTSVYLPVSISVDDTSTKMPTDGSTPTLNFPITVSPAPGPGQPVTVNVATADGTAIAANGDYTPISTSLTFTNATPTQTVSVPLLNAPAAGGSKTVLLTLNTPSTGSNIGDTTAIGTVFTTTAPLPSLYVSDVSLPRPSSGSTNATFTIRLSPPNNNALVPVTYTASAGSGMTEADFDFTKADLTFLPGETTKTVNVPIHGSTTSTGTGNVNLNLSRQQQASLADPGGKAYVVSPLVHSFVSVRPTTAWRSPYEDTTVNVPITLDSPSATPLTFTAATADGTATAGTDYAATASTLTIPAGQTSTFLPVTLLHKAAVGAALTFSVKLAGASGVTQLSSATANVTIVGHTADTTVPSQPSAPSFTGSTPPESAMVGSGYDYTFAATGIPDPSFSLGQGAFPPGVILNSRTGELSGTPTTTGVYSFTVTATNTIGAPAETSTLTITVMPALAAPSFTSASPPTSVTEGTSYSYQFAASGNPSPTFTLGSGALPPGLGLDSSGILSGSPTTPGSYAFSVQAANGVGTPASTGPLTFTVAAAPVAPQFTAAVANPDGTVGSSYAYTFAASGNPSPTFTIVSGVLPDGLTLDRASGLLGGTPTKAGDFTFSVQADNGVGSPAVSASITVTIAAAPAAPEFTDSTPPTSTVAGTAYSYQFVATANPAASFDLASGALPVGLSLTADGRLSGTSSAPGTYTFTVQASNLQGQATTAPITVTVLPPPAAPVFTASDAPVVATVGTPYSYTFVATGNPEPSYSVLAGGSLPAGLSLNPNSGELSGTPTASGNFAFTVQASNGIDPQATKALTISVSEATVSPTFTAAGPSQSAMVGTAYSYVFAASGTPDPVYQLGSGALPAGLTLSSTGVLSGIPTTAGSATFTVTATNSAGSATTPTLTITVASPPSAPVFTASAPATKATMTVPYSYTFVASGSPAPTFSIASGALPTGLSLDAVSGTLAGTPSAAGSFKFAVGASNGIQPTATTKTFTLIVAAAGPSDLATTLSGPTKTKLSGTVTYTLTIKNNGTGTAAQVSGSITVPAGFTLVSASPAATLVNGVVTWSQPTLSNGSSLHWKATFKAPAVGTYTSTATASSGSLDPNGANNSASSTVVVALR